MAGTLTVFSNTPIKDPASGRIIGRKVIVDGVGDASDGSFPVLTLKKLQGYLQPVVRNPGATAPTDNWDIKFLHPDDSTANVTPALADADEANTDVANATTSGSAVPPFFNGGNYGFTITGNSVNSATLRVIMEFLHVNA